MLATTIEQALRETVARLKRSGVPEARRTAEWLLEALTGYRRATLYAYPERVLAPEQAAQLDAWVERRTEGEPVQYILGTADFCGLRLRVTPAVLIPRPETEEVVACGLALLEGRVRPVVLDAGTGSGCIALAVGAARPDAAVHAFDVSEAALAVARENAHALGLSVAFHHADLLGEVLEGIPGDLDLLISNPPYIPDAEADELERHVRDFEPALALFSGDDPLRFYRALARHARRHVRPGGYVVAETHADHAAASAECFETAGLVEVEVRRDLSGRARIVVARQAEGGAY